MDCKADTSRLFQVLLHSGLVKFWKWTSSLEDNFYLARNNEIDPPNTLFELKSPSFIVITVPAIIHKGTGRGSKNVHFHFLDYLDNVQSSFRFKLFVPLLNVLLL